MHRGDVRRRRKIHGVKRLRHPLVGELTLSYETLMPPDDAEQSRITSHAEPGSPSAEALQLLASWGADAARQPGIPSSSK